MKELCIYNCKESSDFRQMLLFLVYKGLGGILTSRDLIFWERSYFFSKAKQFWLGALEFLLFVQKNSTVLSLLDSAIYNPPFNHSLNCYHSYEGDEGEESNQDKFQGGFHHEVEVWIIGGEDK